MFDKKDLFIIKISLEDSVRWYENRISYLRMAEKDGLDTTTELNNNLRLMERTKEVLNEVSSLIS